MAVGDSGKLGYNSFVGIGKETTWGTKSTATTFLEFNSESLNKTRDGEKLATINTGRNPIHHILKNEDVSGSLEAFLNPSSDAVVLLLANAMGGSVTSTGDSDTGYIHDIVQGNLENTLTSLTLTKRVGDTHLFDYIGMRVNTLSIKGEVGSPLMITAELVGKYGTTTTDSLTVALTENAPLLWDGVTYQVADSVGSFPGTEEKITGFEFTINNQLISDDSVYSLGGTQRDLLPAGMLDVNLKISQRFDTSTAYSRAFDHTAMAAQIVMTSTQTIGAGAGSTTNSMYIQIPKGYYTTQTPQVGGPEIVMQEYDIQAIAPSNGAASVLMHVVNGTASY